MLTFIYLHGWVSSPQSQKAQFFQQQFAHHGIELLLPDFNHNDFYHLTLTRQIQQVEALLPTDQEVVMLGSSFGALTALWVAQRQTQVRKLVLIAPAVNFLANCRVFLGEAQWQQWQQDGELPIYHYHVAETKLLHYNFIQDISTYPDSALQRAVPTLALHGEQDEVIPYPDVCQFAAQRTWVDLHSWDCDHQMLSVQDALWDAISAFCVEELHA